jgi:hypothetical protein
MNFQAYKNLARSYNIRVIKVYIWFAEALTIVERAFPL